VEETMKRKIAMTREEDLQALQSAFETFTSYYCHALCPAVSQALYAVGTRNVVAHLIGWNRFTKTGCEQIRRGITPFYFVDPGDDFHHVNALSVQTYASPEKQVLIDELTASFHALLLFLSTVPPGEWETDYGVRYQGEPVTIANTVGALSSDYLEHTKDIQTWVTSADV
jgi:hypothetical protein